MTYSDHIQQKSNSAPFTLNGAQILVVDDDSNNAKLLSVLMTSEGCNVQTCDNVEDALKILENSSIRVALVDLILANNDGFYLAKKIKKNPKTKDIDVIIISIARDLDLVHLAKKIGCLAFIQKPINALTFTQTLTRLIQENSST